MASLAQWPEQVTQAIVINFVHEREQLAQAAIGKAFPRKPVQVVARQVRQGTVFVFAKRHFGIDQQLQILRRDHGLGCTTR